MQELVLKLVKRNMSSFCNQTLPITETFRFCLMVYLYNMFQPSTGSSSGNKEKVDVQTQPNLMKTLNI
jgi:hypothetical protein